MCCYRNRVRNGLWPTHTYNLGVGVAFFSTSLIGDWKAVQPINRQLWALGRILHIPRGIEILSIMTYIWYLVSVNIWHLCLLKSNTCHLEYGVINAILSQSVTYLMYCRLSITTTDYNNIFSWTLQLLFSFFFSLQYLHVFLSTKLPSHLLDCKCTKFFCRAALLCSSGGDIDNRRRDVLCGTHVYSSMAASYTLVLSRLDV